jgi:NAD(P)-dependent dehydrogenase (short-subunit alcohol dehydrogenase family)
MGGRLNGRTVIITGASSGLGAHFARAFAREGVSHLILVARRVDALAELAEALTESGHSASVLACDLSDAESVIRFWERVSLEFPAVDTLVNNAGVASDKTTLEVDAIEFDRVMAINVRAPFLMAQGLFKHLMNQGPSAAMRGRIVNIASIAGLTVLPGAGLYCASKAALVMHTRCLARDWARYGVNVNAICPGFIETPLNTAYLNSSAGQKMVTNFPRRRILEAADLVEPLIHFCSDASERITGSILAIDDGQSL